MPDKSSYASMSAPGWTIHRITTEFSNYHLSIYSGGRGRSVAALRGNSGDRAIDQADSAPLVGGHLLFDTDPASWVGHSLELGTVRTSAIVAVEPETSDIVVQEVTEAATAVMASGGNRRITVECITGEVEVPRHIVPGDFPYPEDNVIRLESAAHFLGAVCDRTALVDDLERFPDLMERYQVALSECLARVNALGSRANRH
ncbi:MAG TPA: hypothetical protein VFH68_13885 [Polyangia bacterium]|nr:hypothetical protein [Polyangia bacterium]